MFSLETLFAHMPSVANCRVRLMPSLRISLWFALIQCVAVMCGPCGAQDTAAVPLLTGPAAELECTNGEVDVFQSGSQLFLDRAYLIKEVPEVMDGFKFIRSKIDRVSVICRRAGVVYVFTPKAEKSPDCREAELLDLGFQKVNLPEVLLFEGGWNRCFVYQKEMAVDEPLNLGKWGVLVVPEKEATSKSATPGTRPSAASQPPAVRQGPANVMPSPDKKVYVLLFGGQSNALGWGYQQYLEDTKDPLAKPQADVEMFYDIPGPGLLPEGTLLPLQSGNSNTNVKPLPNCYPALATAPISRFGPELSFARTVRDRLPDPNAKLAVIKFAMGGSSLWKPDNWLSDGTSNSAADGKLYRIFQDVAKRGIAALKAKYPDCTVEVLGMGWVQGESDALDGKGAEYQKHLTDFIADVRATFGANLPFVLAKISPQQIEGSPDAKKIEEWEVVRKAQDAVAATVPKVIATETSDPRIYPVAKGLSEGQFHYTTPGLLQIGKDLGNALVKAAGLEGGSNKP